MRENAAKNAVQECSFPMADLPRRCREGGLDSRARRECTATSERLAGAQEPGSAVKVSGPLYFSRSAADIHRGAIFNRKM